MHPLSNFSQWPQITENMTVFWVVRRLSGWVAVLSLHSMKVPSLSPEVLSVLSMAFLWVLWLPSLGKIDQYGHFQFHRGKGAQGFTQIK